MTNKLNVFTLAKGKAKFQNTKIFDSRTSANYIRQFFGEDIEIYESCFILLLNRSNTTIGYAKISQGGICGTIVDVKIICKYAIDCLASTAILCHNHPSGSLKPSTADRDITAKAKAALDLVDCQLIDHIILSSEGYFSFADEGLI